MKINPEAVAARLTEHTIASMRTAFATYQHQPSSPQWEALRAIVSTLAAMATGACPASPHLSALDPGVGKTQAVIHFLRALLASPDCRDVGVLICVPRFEQITSIVADAALAEEDFAVYSSDDAMNALGRGKDQHRKARVLFTTHAMLERRVVRYQSFEAVTDFQYRGRARDVRVWDEALVPGKPITVSRWSIGHLFLYLKAEYPRLVADLEELAESLRSERDGERIEIPDLAAKHGVGIDQIRALLKGKPEAEAIAEGLWLLFGRMVTVRQDGGPDLDAAGVKRRGNTILDYQDTLPDDLWPVLILDASGRVRTLYRLWEKRRMGLVRLTEGPKNYGGHTVHVWETPGSKTAWKKLDDAYHLVDGIAAIIRERLDEEWLVIAHKDTTIRSFDVEEEVRKLLPNGAKVRFTTWGKHDATNEYANVPNVILAGTLFFPNSLLEALGRCAARFPSSEGDFDKAARSAVEIGEHHHRILQALCRGRVRKCEGDRCPPDTHSYIIAAPRSGIAKTIDKVLPGATVMKWRPQSRKALRGKKAEAFEIITNIAGNRISAFDVMEAVGWATTKNGRSDFKSRIRDDADFQLALADVGIEEIREGRGGQVWFARMSPLTPSASLA